ncbi:unnamed protein product [Lathyrus sativus]|nr:unnamed protein product [Lathyrus sativus]
MERNEREENGDYKKSKWITKLPYLVILFTSLLISIVGGCVLGWWLHKYHPSNEQLWMVPFGFVLFITPIIVLLSLIVSDPCFSKQVEDSLSNTNNV